jgi:hypothetical protein
MSRRKTSQGEIESAGLVTQRGGGSRAVFVKTSISDDTLQSASIDRRMPSQALIHERMRWNPS